MFLLFVFGICILVLNAQVQFAQNLTIGNAKALAPLGGISFLAEPEPSYAHRFEHLAQLKCMLLKHSREITEPANQDYQCRSQFETIPANIGVSGAITNHNIKHLKRWMQPQKRTPGVALIGAKVHVISSPRVLLV